MQKTEKKKNLTVNSLLRNAFSSGIFSIFPGPTFLLIHCKEINSNTCTVRFVGRKKKSNRISRGRNVSFLFYVTLYLKNQYTDMIYWFKNIILTLTVVLVLHLSVSLYISSPPQCLQQTNPKTGKHSKAIKSM